MKRILLRSLGIAFVLLSFCLACYPFISDYLAEQSQQSDVASYANAVENTDGQELQKAYQAAVEYNENLLGNIVADPFNAAASSQATNSDYQTQLSVGGEIMATLEVPAIDLKLPIYHGTSDEVLKKGAGHLPQTSLPVGGESTHAVITGHTGMPAAKLFSDLNKMQVGDRFYIYVLGKTLTYKVDKIYVIEPDDTKSLRVYEGKDYVTLITCTPFGVNSHRLLVRGVRIVDDKNADADIPESTTPKRVSTWSEKYTYAVLTETGIMITALLLFFTVRFIIRKIINKKQ